jgi:acyl dehydratase
LHDRLIVRWWIEEHEPWFGRTLTRVSAVIRRCGGDLILERTMWGFRSSPQRPVPPVRARAAQPGPGAPAEAPRPLDPAGWRIPGRQKQLTSERIRLFSGWGSQNLHTSDDVAKDAGLPAPIASAAQAMGYLCEYMVDGFGEEWLADGSWVLTFRKPMFAGDQLSPLGTLQSAEPTTRGAQCTVDLRLLNHHGLATAQGTATGHCALSPPGHQPPPE